MCAVTETLEGALISDSQQILGNFGYLGSLLPFLGAAN